MRSRKVISHLDVTTPLAAEEAECLVYRDARADMGVLRTAEAVSRLTEPARARALLGLQALAINAMVYNRNGAIEYLESVPAAKRGLLPWPRPTLGLARRRRSAEVLFAMLRDGTFYEPQPARSG
ncbi:hypothetical protein ACFT38_39390 [Streptomyces sp. NPDC056975]|uniref:hypothetical protein n=1 Tax=Streptomyces sp. NPDC056975 TaxID=3345985 RepID=UPI00363847AF